MLGTGGFRARHDTPSEDDGCKDIYRQLNILPVDVKGIFRLLDSGGTAHTLSNVEGISYRHEPGPDAKP